MNFVERFSLLEVVIVGALQIKTTKEQNNYARNRKNITRMSFVPPVQVLTNSLDILEKSTSSQNSLAILENSTHEQYWFSWTG